MNLERIRRRNKIQSDVRRYSLAEIISESYNSLYNCEKNSKLYRVVESHIESIRENPRNTEQLSRDLSTIKALIRLGENAKIYTKDLEDEVDECDIEPRKKRFEESIHDEDVAPADEESKHDEEVEDIEESEHDEDVEELEETEELSDEEIEYLTNCLEEMRKNKKLKEARRGIKVIKEKKNTESLHEDAPLNRFRIFDKVRKEIIDSYTEKKDAEDWVEQSVKDGDYKRDDLDIIDSLEKPQESKKVSTYESLDLSEFNKNSTNKAFMKTLKKLAPQLHEGKALTRQESISLYKATNSALTHLSVELEKNPKFLAQFKECTTLLSKDAVSILEALKNNKAPSKKTMQSLAEFSEVLFAKKFNEAEDDELEAEEDNAVEISPEAEEFYQDYADARAEAHEEVAEKYADSEDPDVVVALEQDAVEVALLQGEEIEEEPEEVEDTPEEELGESEQEEVEEEERDPFEDDGEITDDELAELKKHLKEMRQSKKNS